MKWLHYFRTQHNLPTYHYTTSELNTIYPHIITLRQNSTQSTHIPLHYVRTQHNLPTYHYTTSELNTIYPYTFPLLKLIFPNLQDHINIILLQSYLHCIMRYLLNLSAVIILSTFDMPKHVVSKSLSLTHTHTHTHHTHTYTHHTTHTHTHPTHTPHTHHTTHTHTHTHTIHTHTPHTHTPHTHTHTHITLS
jgi:hypothetical protein